MGAGGRRIRRPVQGDPDLIRQPVFNFMRRSLIMIGADHRWRYRLTGVIAF
jgi:hypothetical protein